MSRELSGREYETWLAAFLPRLFIDDLVPANVSDRSDPKIVHLDGLNLSRAWNLQLIAQSIDDDAGRARLLSSARDHIAATLPHVASEHYEGSHWLGSFAVYALTRAN